MGMWSSCMNDMAARWRRCEEGGGEGLEGVVGRKRKHGTSVTSGGSKEEKEKRWSPWRRRSFSVYLLSVERCDWRQQKRSCDGAAQRVGNSEERKEVGRESRKKDVM